MGKITGVMISMARDEFNNDMDKRIREHIKSKLFEIERLKAQINDRNKTISELESYINNLDMNDFYKSDYEN